MRVMIFESDHRGHRLNFVRLLAGAVRELVDDVIVVVGIRAKDSPEYQLHLAGLEGRLKLDASIPTLPEENAKAEATAKLKALEQAVKRCQPDWLYLPSADAIAQLEGIARLRGRRHVPNGIEVEALLLQGRVGYPAANFRERLRNTISLQATALADWPQLFFLDPMAFKAVTRRGGAMARRSRLMPDPVEENAGVDRILARQSLGLPVDGRIIGCPGLMDERKGIHLLIPAFAKAQLQADDRLLLAGRLTPPIRALLEGPHRELVQRGKIIVMDRFLSDAELSSAIAAMNVVCTAYPNHRASGSLAIRAARAGRFVLGADKGWTGAIVPRFGLGATVNVNNQYAFAQAIVQSLDDSAAFSLNDAGRRFVQFHTPENFCAVWTSRLRNHLGKDPLPVLDWEWVKSGIEQVR